MPTIFKRHNYLKMKGRGKMRIIKSGNLYSVDAFLNEFSGGEHDVQKINAAAITGSAESGDLILYEAASENDGDNLAAVLKERERAGAKVVFLVPAAADIRYVSSLEKLGADDIIKMPCDYPAFFSTLKKFAVNSVSNPAGQQFGIIGNSPQLDFIRSFIKKVGPSGIPVLIEGESGTGKELAAYGVHKASLRAEEPFIPVNCGAIPKELLENEFFGHEKGSFTGAMNDKKGLFEIADKGTLFIDEIGEMDPQAQVKLLRALETGKFMRIGGTKEIKVDVRIVAATNRNVKEEMKAGRFRKDLFYRLSSILIKLPALRDRREDIPVLVEYFLSHSRITPEEALNKKVAGDAMNILKNYNWPGNVRELLNVVERAVVLSGNRAIITKEDLPPHLTEPDEQQYEFDEKETAVYKKDMKLDEYMDSVEKKFILQALKSNSSDRPQTAAILGISIANLYRKIKKYNI
jgi:DNA-binding NtrC family response regulator